jgi:translation initiation factor IF-3
MIMVLGPRKKKVDAMAEARAAKAARAAGTGRDEAPALDDTEIAVEPGLEAVEAEEAVEAPAQETAE